MFLKSIYPNATPLIDEDKGHIVTLIDGTMYDITGKVNGQFQPLSNEDIKLAETWSFAENKYISLGECPNCEEPLLVVQ
ncbi:hypothetical protein GBO14_04635 [Pseudoalteromonas shioyasakiensis]|uniref:hypothetical protein n=1 Tax=Pseudoalteromonas sp. NCCP-2140 TaxID=2942288 RepID=UPI00203B3A9A|nr:MULTISPECIES: hypothetical protein [Pseudoalteromonas]MCO6354038.1 hypothetical protein [Pseudoalteromonas shioyasakiensis]GKW53638.1 hypothetical protein NCCP2140_26910 [Pseudoalteromonas sp. NCCP-2140]